MTAPFPAARFLDGVAADLRATQAALDRREADLGELPAAADREGAWKNALDRLEGSLSGWQGILGDMAERVRAAQDDLAALDADLRRSLAAFAAARKYLQGTDREAASGSGS